MGARDAAKALAEGQRAARSGAPSQSEGIARQPVSVEPLRGFARMPPSTRTAVVVSLRLRRDRSADPPLDPFLSFRR